MRATWGNDFLVQSQSCKRAMDPHPVDQNVTWEMAAHLAPFLKSLEDVPAPVQILWIFCDPPEHEDGLHCLWPEDVVRCVAC